MFILISAIFAWVSIASCIVFVIIALTTRNAPDMVCYEKAEKDRERALKVADRVFKCAAEHPELTLEILLKAQAKAASMELIDPNDFKNEL